MNKLLKELKYSLYLTIHPFKGFWEIKNEKKGRMKTAYVLLFFFVLSTVAGGLYKGYLFNEEGLNLNIYITIGSILAIYLLWCISNWCLTSLFDGEGTFGDIFKATSYALVPLIIAQFVLIPVSHMLSIKEAAFYSLIFYVCMIWTVFLIIVSVIITHQYSLTKAVVIIVSIVAGMCMISYILLLLINLIQQMAGFVITLANEISLRWS